MLLFALVLRRGAHVGAMGGCGVLVVRWFCIVAQHTLYVVYACNTHTGRGCDSTTRWRQTPDLIIVISRAQHAGGGRNLDTDLEVARRGEAVYDTGHALCVWVQFVRHEVRVDPGGRRQESSTTVHNCQPPRPYARGLQ